MFGVGPTSVAPVEEEGRILGPAHDVATRVENTPSGLSEKNQSACVHCVHGTKILAVDLTLEFLQERCQKRTAIVFPR